MAKNYTLTVKEDSAGIVDVLGFKVAGVSSDIRNKNDGRLDTAIIKSDVLATAAGTFTTNDVKAAPVYVDIEHLWKSPKIGAVIANSGNANACTGQRGMDDARKMCALVANEFGLLENEVLVSSTGRIGEFMPMEKIEKGIKEAVLKISDSQENGIAAASAILTSDTRKKTISVTVNCGDKEFHMGAMAKGAGMIEPNMATMLAYIACDAEISQKLLKECLSKSVEMSFNCISVDGDMSTNDTVLVLCNGQSHVKIDDNADLLEAFKEALQTVCSYLASHIVADGEKITKVVQVNISGAKSEEQARKIAKSIANSMLVKSAWYGGDPNWGRLVDAAGYAKTGIDFQKMDLAYNNVPVIAKGEVLANNKPLWKKEVAEKSFAVNMNLNLGEFSWTVLTTDLSEAYVDFNKGE